MDSDAMFTDLAFELPTTSSCTVGTRWCTTIAIGLASTPAASSSAIASGRSISSMPIPAAQRDPLRLAAVRIVATHLGRSESSLRREVALWMLDAVAEARGYSMRRVRTNLYRIVVALSWVADVVRWAEDTRAWRNPSTTILAHGEICNIESEPNKTLRLAQPKSYPALQLNRCASSVGAAQTRETESADMRASGEEGYKPGPDFEENSKAPLVDISSSDSTELWLIQWPINQLQPADFSGKELTLKLHRDGKLGGFDSASGKSYDFESFAAHEPDATVFQVSESETKIVGKISRRVCLVRYPQPAELEKPRFNLSSQKSEGSARRSMYHSSAIPLRHGSLLGKERMSYDTLASAYNPEERSVENSQKSKKKRHEDGTVPSEISARSTEHASRTSGLHSDIGNDSLTSEQSHREKSKKKKKVKVEE
ncbi:hypothetical protein Cni_G21374 [Canna indica]|uniref:Uncharacterized protein n=1 Tax=Canna indica TaxID=4628 RepID=A0AAQ3KRZ0_9LILI|nr:hypothetical protein Cni_G21374 [Canna indica]